MDRRTFISRSLLLSAGSLIVPRALRSSKDRAEVITPIRRNVGTFTGRGGTIGWLADEHALVVIDAQFPNSAEIFYEQVQFYSSQPSGILINTHHHADHTAGNLFFNGRVESIIANEHVPGYQRSIAVSQGTLDQQVYADSTFSDSKVLDTGDEVLHLTHYGPAHTGGDTVVRFEKANIIHMGDLVFNRWFPFIDIDGGGAIENWIRTLEQIVSDADRDTIFIFGHGSTAFGITGNSSDVVLMADYLDYLLEFVNTEHARGRSLEELMQVTQPGRFPDHVNAGGRLSFQSNLNAAWKDLGLD